MGKLIQEINVKSDAKEKKIILESSQIQAIYAYFSKKRTIQMLELKENTLQFIYSGDDLESLITELIQANLKIKYIYEAPTSLELTYLNAAGGDIDE
jgi:hypothetical protein